MYISHIKYDVILTPVANEQNNSYSSNYILQICGTKGGCITVEWLERSIYVSWFYPSVYCVTSVVIYFVHCRFCRVFFSVHNSLRNNNTVQLDDRLKRCHK